MIDTSTNAGKAAFAAALAAVVIGVGVLAGWVFDLEFLKSIVPGFVAMNPAAAVAFILAGASLALFLLSPYGKDQKSRALILTARLCALAVALIGLSRLVAILCGWDLNIDRWFFTSKESIEQPFPNHISPNAALNFFLLGGALLFVEAKNRSVRFGAEFCVVVVGFGSLLAVLGYAYGVQSFYRLGVFIPMALPTAVAFSALSIAFFLSHTDGGLLAILAGSSPGGTMTRRLLPAAVLVPAGFGGLELHGELAGIFDSAAGNATFAVGNILVLTVLICCSARALSQADIERKSAEEALHRQQTELQVLFDSIPAMIWFKDTKNNILRINKRVVEIIGKSVEEIEGKPTLEKYYADDLEVIRSGAPKLGIIETIRDHAGKEFWVETDKVPYRDKDGKIVGIVVLAHDITESKRVDETVRRLASIVENSSEAIIGKSLNGIITSWNPAAEKMFGYAASEIIGQSLQVLIPPDRLSEESQILDGFVKGELVRHFETVRIRKDGQRIDVSATISPIKDTNGKIVGASKIVRDITERKRVESELAFERDLLRSLLDNSPDHIYFKDDQSRFIKNSKAHARQFGLDSPDALAGKTDFDFFSEKRARIAFEDEQEIIRTGQAIIAKTERELWQGGLRETWALTSKMPLRDKNSKIIGTFGISKDITALKQVEAELAYQSDLFWTLINHSPDSIFFKDLQSRFVALSRSEVNHLWQVSLSRRPPHPAGEEERLPPHLASVEEFEKYVIGKSDAEFYGPERAVDFDRDEKEVMGTGRVIGGKVERTIHQDGSDSYYLVTKVPWRNKDGKIIGLFGTGKDITELKRAEAAVVETISLLDALLQNTTDHIYFKDLQSRFIHFSREMLKLFQLSHPDELKGKTDFDFFSEEHARNAYDIEQEIIRTDKPIFNLVERATLLDGQIAWVLTSKMPRHDKEGNIIGTMGISRDITEHKRLETQLFQAQKMEIVGKLAGGVAHEFNSILTTIIGQSELLLGDLPSGSALNKSAAEINKAAGRAAVLTQQLLAYGRKQTFQTETLDLNSLLTDMEAALRHLMGGDTDVRMIPAAGLQAVKADAGQIEQVIMNMAINAHDAMPHGGKLTLETSNVTFGQENTDSNPDLKPGDYVMLAITDTGTGMSLQVQARVFEPFFSTKGIGEGAGLGLSTCYGIIKQSGGNITVRSELAQGTSFKIYLPQVKQQAALPIQRLDSADLPRGTETILLVGDDPTLREVAATLLGQLGYKVLTAANGPEAMRLARQPDSGPIDLLFTDMVMPHMSGKQLAEQTRALNPRTKVLFASAYTENDIIYQGLLNKDAARLREPYTPSELANKLREVLDP